VSGAVTRMRKYLGRDVRSPGNTGVRLQPPFMSPWRTRVFAHYLNLKPKLISEWERGEKKPSGPSLKLLSIVRLRGLDTIV